MQRINDEGRTCFWWPERWDIFHSPLSVLDSSTALTTVSLTQGSALLWVWQSKIVYVSKQVMGKSVAQHHIWALSQSVWKNTLCIGKTVVTDPFLLNIPLYISTETSFPFPWLVFSPYWKKTHMEILYFIIISPESTAQKPLLWRSICDFVLSSD